MTLSLLDVRIFFFENQAIGLKFLIVDRNAQDAPQKNPVAIENSLRLHTRGSPVAATEVV